MMSDYIEKNLDRDGVDRRGFLKCMAWAGTGTLCVLQGGVLKSFALSDVLQQKIGKISGDLSFVQISDSHIGFNKEANPDVTATLREAIAKVNALPTPPSFVLHTGDLTQLSKPEEFDTLAESLKSLKTGRIFYVPGEHDVLSDNGQMFRERFGQGTEGDGWYSFNQNGAHFIGLVNVLNLKAGGLGNLGDEQLEWLQKDVSGLKNSTPIVVFAHIPLWAVYPQWGWGTGDSEQALSYLKRFGSVTVFERTHSPNHAEGGRKHHVPHGVFEGVPATAARQGRFTRPDESASRTATQRVGDYRCELRSRQAYPGHH
jgi:3',5'-cyclic-AMP phosphodiesterase